MHPADNTPWPDVEVAPHRRYLARIDDVSAVIRGMRPVAGETIEGAAERIINALWELGEVQVDALRDFVVGNADAIDKGSR